MTSAPSADTSSRRALLTRSGSGLAAGAALLLGGCGSQHRARHRHHSLSPDVEILKQLLAVERDAVVAYEAAIPLLSGTMQKAAQQFLGDELAHASELYGLISKHGVKPPKPSPSYNIGHSSSPASVLALLHSLERRQIAGYLQAIPLISPGDARSALAAILASDAQHVAIVRAAQHQPPLDGPFVTGTA